MKALFLAAVLTSAARVEFTTFTVKTPADASWHWTANQHSLHIVLLHGTPQARISAAWTPLLESYRADDPDKTMEQYI